VDLVSVTVSGEYKHYTRRVRPGTYMSCKDRRHDLFRRTLLIVICWSMPAVTVPNFRRVWVKEWVDLLIIMTKYTLILAPLEVFAKRTFLGQGPKTAALAGPEQWKIK